MDKCHYINDKEAGRFLIPGCLGTVVYGIERCTCRSGKSTEKTVKILWKEMEKSK